MDRIEGTALTVAVLGHAALFAVLTAGYLAPDEEKPKIEPTPIEVSLSDVIGLETTAPEISQEEMAAKLSPTEAPVEPDSAPEPATEAQPEPEPQPPKPEPRPAPKPEPAKPTKPAPVKPAPAKPAPAKPTPAKPAPAKPAPAKPAPAKPTKAPPGTGNQPSKPSRKPGGGLPDYAKEFGQGNKPSQSNSTKPAAAATGADVASFGALITRQIQPCANRQVTPGPGAERIRVLVRLQLNRNGSLAAEPEITGVQGNDEDNNRYVARVKDLARAVFKGCSPLRGLPDDLYDVPRGWKSIRLSYKLP